MASVYNKQNLQSTFHYITRMQLKRRISVIENQRSQVPHMLRTYSIKSVLLVISFKVTCNIKNRVNFQRFPLLSVAIQKQSFMMDYKHIYS